MSRYNHPKDLTWKELILQSLVVVAAVVVVVWFLPRNSSSSFSEELKGKPWPYGQFIAPFDFTVFKSDEQMARERDSIRHMYEPYFELQADVEAKQVARFRADFRSGSLGDVPMSYRGIVEEQMLKVYDRGILSGSDADMLHTDSVHNLRIYSGTEAIVRPVGHVFTQKSAYEHLLAMADSMGIGRAKLQRLSLHQYLMPNLSYDQQKSEEYWADLEGSLSPSSDMILAGQSIIDRGDLVNERVYNILRSYEREYASRNANDNNDYALLLLGQSLYVALFLFSLLCYFNLFRNDYISSFRSVLLLLALVLFFPLATSFLMRNSLLSVYLIPYAILPIFARVFLDSRTAFVTHIVTIMLCAVSLKSPFEFIATQSVAGLVAIYSLRELSERSQIIRTAFFVTLASMVIYLSIELIHGKNPFATDSTKIISLWVYRHMLFCGILLIFSYPLMYLLERSFGFTSNVTLVELSNINRPILRRLSEQAPGTFQHSMQVSNLASEAARKIGAKSQLVRTGALYHDIGKIYNPPFFTENQAGVNPHDQLSFEESARVIVRHVTEGQAMADKYQLPHVIREFISTHHGSGMVKYFYISAQNKNPDQPVNPAPFTYPGPNPYTTEQAILMMADAVEASSRSLKEYTEESIGQLVERIIDNQIQEGFFRQCPITFLDIQTVKEVFKEKLKTIYHTRISYPQLK